jgi:hypothetical protein
MNKTSAKFGLPEGRRSTMRFDPAPNRKSFLQSNKDLTRDKPNLTIVQKNINTLPYNLKLARVVTRYLPPYGGRDNTYSCPFQNLIEGGRQTPTRTLHTALRARSYTRGLSCHFDILLPKMASVVLSLYIVSSVTLHVWRQGLYISSRLKGANFSSGDQVHSQTS